MQVANGSVKTIASSLQGGVLTDGSKTGYISPTRPQRSPGVPDTGKDVPLSDGLDVFLLFLLLCVGYAIYICRNRKRQSSLL
jgi:hypothetical protein